MSKRPAGQRAPVQGQADLFGAMPAPPSQTKARLPPNAHPPFAQKRSARASPANEHGASATATNGLLNVRQAALRLGLSKSTLDKMRCAGKGPRFIKSTDRAVRYDPADLEAWIANRRRTSTSRD